MPLRGCRILDLVELMAFHRLSCLFLVLVSSLFLRSHCIGSAGVVHASKLSLFPLSDERELFLVAMQDGTVHALDSQSGKLEWSFSTGPPLTSSFQMYPDNDKDTKTRTGNLNNSNAATLDAEYYDEYDENMEDELYNAKTEKSLLLNLNGNLMKFDSSLSFQELLYVARELVTSSPTVTIDGNFILGSKSSHGFVIDFRNGNLLRQFDSIPYPTCPQFPHSDAQDSNSCNDFSVFNSTYPSSLEDHSLFLSRTDYHVKFVNPHSGVLIWNVTVSELNPLSAPFMDPFSSHVIEPKVKHDFSKSLIMDGENSLLAFDTHSMEASWKVMFPSKPVSAFSSSGLSFSCEAVDSKLLKTLRKNSKWQSSMPHRTLSGDRHVNLPVLYSQNYMKKYPTNQNRKFTLSISNDDEMDNDSNPQLIICQPPRYPFLPGSRDSAKEKYANIRTHPSGLVSPNALTLRLSSRDTLEFKDSNKNPLSILPRLSSTVIVLSIGIIIAAVISLYLFEIPKLSVQDAFAVKKTVVKKKKGRKSVPLSDASPSSPIENDKDDENAVTLSRKSRSSNQSWKKGQKFDLILDRDEHESVPEVKIGRLTVTSKVIGYGSHGTLVLEGELEGRRVAVKRLLGQFYEKARKEISALIASDEHPNVVRCFAMEEDDAFVYVALERCWMNLGDLIMAASFSVSFSSSPQRMETNQNFESVIKDHKICFWDEKGFPTSTLQKLMKDVVSGLAHLHDLGIVHRDLKPQNVLITATQAIKKKQANNEGQLVLRSKLSDMGLSKRLLDGASSLDFHLTGMGSSGWQAPEQLTDGMRQTRSVDLFSLGCVLFFCISGGRHPFGERHERDSNILKGVVDFFPVDHIPEASHLLRLLLHSDPSCRPPAKSVLLHPLFWTSDIRLSFLRDASDRLEGEDRIEGSQILADVESRASTALGCSWNEKLHPFLLENLGKYRRYNFRSVRDLLRVIRNKCNHYRELPTSIQEMLGPIPDGYIDYFLSRFPHLLIEVYCALQKHCSSDYVFRRYFYA